MDHIDGAQVLARIGRRWWLVAAIVALVAVGALLTALPTFTSPPYVESATFAIVAVPSEAGSYGGTVARSTATMAEITLASEVIASSGFASAVADRLRASGMAVDTSTLRDALDVALVGDQVALTVHWATKPGTERVMDTAFAEIGAELTNGAVTATGSQKRDVLLHTMVTSAGAGAVVDEAAQQAALRGVALRLLVALGVGGALLVAVSLWGVRRRHGVEGVDSAETLPVGENE